MDVTTKPAGNLARAAVMGELAPRVTPAAEVLYRAGGQEVLSESGKEALRRAAQTRGVEAVTKATSAPNLPGIETLRPFDKIGNAAGRAALAGGGEVQGAARAGSAGAQLTVGGAVRVVAERMGAAAAIGGAVDGAIALGEAAIYTSRGEWCRDAAIKHVVGEAATGALSSGAGIGAAVVFVALTGTVSAPAVAVVGASAAIATKMGLTRMNPYRQCKTATASTAAENPAPPLQTPPPPPHPQVVDENKLMATI